MAGEKRCAVIECFQGIPCNPCVTSCRQEAITMESLTALPVLHPERCIGCGTCVAACPGQAIFLTAGNTETETADITFPYEYLPLPEEGQSVTATDRDGRPVCDAVVKEVRTARSFNRTALVTLTVPLSYKDEVRFMLREEKKEVRHA